LCIDDCDLIIVFRTTQSGYQTLGLTL